MSVLTYAAAQGFIRAKLSGLLSQEAWSQLLNASTSGEMAQQLRRSALAPAVTREGAIRLQMLRGAVANAGSILARFLPRRPRELIAWYSRRFEIENLKTVLRTVHYGLERPRALNSLIPLQTTPWRWERLLEADSVAAVLEKIRKSPYFAPLEHALERYGHEGRLFYFEIALDLFYFQRLVRLIESQRGKDALDASRYLGRWIAVENLLWAYRYRVYGRMTPEEVINYTLHRAFAAGLDTVRRVALGSPLTVEARRLGFRLPPGISEAQTFTEIDLLAAREQFRSATKIVRRPLFHLDAVFACLWLLEAEVQDLATLLEGKAMGISGPEISQRLLRAA